MPEITKVNVGGTTYDIVDNTKVSKTGDTMSGTLTIDKSGGIQFNYNDAYARLNLIGYNGTTPTSYTPRLQVLGGGGSTYGVQIEGLATPSVDSAAANKKYVDQKVASAIGDITGVEFNTDYTSYASLPTTGEAGVIYLIPNSGSTPNIYDEYIYTSGSYEKIGTTETDLSGYVPTTRTINGKALTTNISLTVSDIAGASAVGHTHDYSKVTFTQTNTSGDQIGTITIDGTSTILYADANTDTKVTQTLTAPTASVTYPILFTNTASKSATSTDTARFDTGFHYNPYFGSVFTKGPASASSSLASGYRLGAESGTQTGAFINGVVGTTETVGQTRLFLGNNIASGTADNAEGSIMLYGSGAYYSQIKSAAADSNKAITFPNLGGTVALLEGAQTFTGAKTFNATTTLNNRIVGKIGTPSTGNYTTVVPSAAGVNGQIMFVTIS